MKKLVGPVLIMMVKLLQPMSSKLFIHICSWYAHALTCSCYGGIADESTIYLKHPDLHSLCQELSLIRMIIQ